MSGHATSRRPFDEEDRTRPSPAADVTFAGVGKVNGTHHQEPADRPDLSKNGKERWIERGDKLKDRLLPTSTQRAVSEGAPNGVHDGDTGSNNTGGSRRGRVRKSGSWLLNSMATNGSPRASDEKASLQNGSPLPDTTQAAQNRMSTESSHGSSPLSRGISTYQNGQDSNHAASRPTNMDPAQLVQMALKLSESRRRHASGPVTLPNLTTTAGLHSQAMHKPLGHNVDSVQGSLDSRTSSQWEPHQRGGMPGFDADNTVYTFSPATLARAEKARKYFELADGYRRLLHFLPPLKPDAEAPGNFTFETTSAGSQAQPDIRRLRSNTYSRHDLGRPYNPLQVLRDRRLRHRERRPFATPADHFQDTDSVTTWLEEVQKSSQNPQYRGTGDVVRLPHFVSSFDAIPGNEEETRGHKRSNTAGTVIVRSENDWSVDPTELLADAYWLEQGDNKLLIESRGDRKLFPPSAHSRRSVDMHGDGKDLVSGQRSVDDSKKNSPQQRKIHPRRLLPLPVPDRIRHNRLGRLSRSASVSSASSVEGRKPLPLPLTDGANEESSRPARHVNGIITEESNGELPSSPIASPDRWDSKHTPFPINRHDHHLEEGDFADLNGHADHRGHQSPKAETANGHGDRNQFVSSQTEHSLPTLLQAEGSASTANAENFTDTSTALKSKPSDKANKAPLSRGTSKERDRSERLDFAELQLNGHTGSLTSQFVDRSRLSVDSARPAVFKRHKTADSLAGIVHRGNRSSTEPIDQAKAPSSAVGRLLRGGRIGNMVRNESSKLGDRIRGRDRNGEGFTSDVSVVMSDYSDEDGSASDAAKIVTSAEESETSPRASFERIRSRPRLRYHIPNLPSFKSSSAREKQTLEAITSEDNDDHITRQQAALRYRNRSPRFEALAPPRIALPDDGRDESSYGDPPTEQSDAIDERRRSYGFLAPSFRARSRSHSSSRMPLERPGTVGRRRNGQTMPMTGLSNVPSQASAAGHRHWSISDNRLKDMSAEKEHRASPRDVARVRALLLASGIKAREITLRLKAPSTHPPAFLAQAVAISDTELGSVQHVPQKEEHLLAARLLSNFLDSSLGRLQQDFKSFQSDTLPSLTDRQDRLRMKVSDELAHLVHNTSDAADAFNVELSTQATLRTKQVDDAVDAILRLQRRQFRLLRRTGFKLLEWLVLSILWWVWFIVVCFKTVRRVVVAVFRFLYWLFTF